MFPQVFSCGVGLTLSVVQGSNQADIDVEDTAASMDRSLRSAVTDSNEWY